MLLNKKVPSSKVRKVINLMDLQDFLRTHFFALPSRQNDCSNVVQKIIVFVSSSVRTSVDQSLLRLCLSIYFHFGPVALSIGRIMVILSFCRNGNAHLQFFFKIMLYRFRSGIPECQLGDVPLRVPRLYFNSPIYERF